MAYSPMQLITLRISTYVNLQVPLLLTWASAAPLSKEI